jgi:hypothetical protein
MTAAVRLCALLFFALAGSTVARAGSDYSIAMPRYIEVAYQNFTTALAQKSVVLPPQPACVGFPGLDPTNREFMVSCIATATCWKLAIGSVERRLSVYYFSGTLNTDCSPAELAPIHAAVVSSFISCASDGGRDASMARLLNEPLDASDPDKAADLQRQMEADAAYVNRFRIDALCMTMIGHRAITADSTGRRDELWLGYLKPEFAPP